ncbi:type II toxin-antitoxin system Phd/YefM family antitoxin [bacterium]|nr:type II toxin-antitoxin system Phd/YefM family antitoxin [bacterium]
MTITPTQLRANLYKVLDQVLETHQPIEILRKGQILKLIIEDKQHHRKLTNLEPHPDAILGDPNDFVDADWSSYWQGGHEI